MDNSTTQHPYWDVRRICYAWHPWHGQACCSLEDVETCRVLEATVWISNHRLTSLEDGKVTFRWKDYAHGVKKRKMTLDASEFIWRFLLHVLPKGLVRIHCYGWMANRCRRQRAVQCRELPGPAATCTG